MHSFRADAREKRGISPAQSETSKHQHFLPAARPRSAPDTISTCKKNRGNYDTTFYSVLHEADLSNVSSLGGSLFMVFILQ